MKALGTPRTGEGPRYTRVKIEGREDHLLRAPTFAAVSVIRQLSRGASGRSRAMAGSQDWIEAHGDLFGAIIGLCWWHELFDFDAHPPAYSADAAEWLRYGDAISDELIEQGYDMLAFVELYTAAMDIVNRVHRVIGAAQEQADFSDAAPGPQIDPPSTPATP